MTGKVYALVGLAVAIGALIAGCGGTSSDSTTLDDAGASALYAATLGTVISDATAIERAAAIVASEAQGQHQHQMGDGSGFDVESGGQYHVFCPDGTEVVGAPDGPRQIRLGDTILDADWEDQGQGDTQRLRIHLRDGSECLVGEPGTDGQMQCEGPNQWRFRVRVREEGGLEMRFGAQLFTVERGADGALTVQTQGHGTWTVTVEDDGSLLVTNPGGEELFRIVIAEDGTLAVTSLRSGRTVTVTPVQALPGDAA